MLPLVGVPPTIAAFLSKYRDIFCRQEGFDHLSRYITGLLLSPNKTLESIHSQQIWPEGKEVKRRAMHAAVFEAGWKSKELMPRHREVVAHDHRGRGREVIGIDWTLSHHDRGAEIFGVKRAYDYVDKRMSRYQTVVTAAIANREMIDGLEVVVQTPDYQKEELAYLKMTSRDNYESMEQVLQRLSELLHYQKNRQRATCQGQTSERFTFAQRKQTVGQKLYCLTREALGQLLSLVQGLFAQGQSCQQVLEVLMPA